MNKFNLSAVVSASPTVNPFLRTAAIRVSQILEMTEPRYGSLVSSAEKNEWFLKLSRSVRGRPVIRRAPWPQTRLASVYSPEGAHLPAAQGVIDASLSGHGEIMGWIRDLGRENFERCFLAPAVREDPARIAGELGLPEPRVKAIQDFLESVSIRGEAEGGRRPAVPGRSWYPVARVELDGGEPWLSWLTPHYAKGRYRVDYKALEDLRRSGKFSKSQWRGVSALVARLERINRKQSALAAVLGFILKFHRTWLLRGPEGEIRPVSQSLAAARLKIAPSTLSRVCRGRTLVTPWGEEMKLERFFPSRKARLMNRVRRLSENCPGKSSALLQEELSRRFGMNVSRRLINLYRRSIRMETAHDR